MVSLRNSIWIYHWYRNIKNHFKQLWITYDSILCRTMSESFYCLESAWWNRWRKRNTPGYFNLQDFPLHRVLNHFLHYLHGKNHENKINNTFPIIVHLLLPEQMVKWPDLVLWIYPVLFAVCSHILRAMPSVRSCKKYQTLFSEDNHNTPIPFCSRPCKWFSRHCSAYNKFHNRTVDHGFHHVKTEQQL